MLTAPSRTRVRTRPPLPQRQRSHLQPRDAAVHDWYRHHDDEEHRRWPSSDGLASAGSQRGRRWWGFGLQPRTPVGERDTCWKASLRRGVMSDARSTVGPAGSGSMLAAVEALYQDVHRHPELSM